MLIPMHNSIGVHTSNSRNYFVKYIASLFLWKIMPLGNDIKELFPFAILSNYEYVLAFLKNFINLKNVWMVLSNCIFTSPFRREISFRIMALALPNFRVLIFFIALMFFVC